MHALQDRLKVSFGTGHALWSWCLRHASWIINRYNPYKGTTSYELVYGKAYTGQVCEFAEPVFGFVRSPLKGNARWERMIFIGKGGKPGFIFAVQWRFFGFDKISEKDQNRLEDTPQLLPSV